MRRDGDLCVHVEAHDVGERLTFPGAGDVLTIKGQRNGEAVKQGEGYRSIERSYGAYQRSFRIPGGVDSTKVEATYEAGVLKVSLPKPETSKPRQIEVKVN